MNAPLYSWNFHFIFISPCLFVLFSRSAQNTFDLASVLLYIFLFPISTWHYSLPRRNRRQWLCDFFSGWEGGGGCITVCAKMGNTIHNSQVFITLIVEILSRKMADPQQKTNNITPDVLEAAEILVMMRQGMRGFLEAQQARYRMPYVYYTSLNPTISQLHYFSAHGIPFSPLYDISPIAPAAYQFSPLAQAQQELYYGMLTSAQCIVGPPRKQDSTGVDFTVGFGEKESLQPGK